MSRFKTTAPPDLHQGAQSFVRRGGLIHHFQINLADAGLNVDL